MTKITIGAYWEKRSITLREFANELRKHIFELSNSPFNFANIALICTSPNSYIKLDTNLANLDDMLYRYAWTSDRIYENANPDGTPSWLSSCNFGFSFSFICSRPNDDANIEFSVSAGKSEDALSNCAIIIIKYPTASKATPLLDYDNVKKMLFQLLARWRPQFGKATSFPFRMAFQPDDYTEVGWLTYLQSPDASGMRNNPDLIAAGIEMEAVSMGGSLFSLDRELPSPNNEIVVARAQLLRSKLMEYRLIKN
jgi:hypothetical protein